MTNFKAFVAAFQISVALRSAAMRAFFTKDTVFHFFAAVAQS